MKIRSITTFINPGWPIDPARMQQAGEFSKAAQYAYTQAGFDVQTTRLATVPFPTLLGDIQSEAIPFAQQLESMSAENGFNYISIGPALPSYPTAYKILPELFAATENVFASGVIASRTDGISLPAIRAAADIIMRSSTLDPNGFGNLYFAALANVPAGAPFFPAAYHAGDQPSFAIAAEAADLAVAAFTDPQTLAQAQSNLIASLNGAAEEMLKVAADLTNSWDISFGGLDLTPAPFPEEARSLGTAMEKLGPIMGGGGSLAAAAFLANTLDQTSFTKVGFNGLMLPVLEDFTLAKRAAEGTLTVTDLLLYSAVCGTGLDTIPLAGDVHEDAVAALLLDMAALAMRLDKPLTARLMPIPGKSVGDLTGFDFDFFANSRVMALDHYPLTGLLAGDESFHLYPRTRTGTNK